MQVVVGQTPQHRLFEAAYVDVEIRVDGLEGGLLRLRDLWRGDLSREGWLMSAMQSTQPCYVSVVGADKSVCRSLGCTL